MIMAQNNYYFRTFICVLFTL